MFQFNYSGISSLFNLGRQGKKKEAASLYCTRPQSAILITSKAKYNLLNGEVSVFSNDRELEDELNVFKATISSMVAESMHKTFVFHLFYEMGEILKRSETSDEIKLWISLEYTETEVVSNRLFLPQKINWTTSKEFVNREVYAEKFMTLREHLLKGDCYQVNLTFPFEIESEDVLFHEKLVHHLFSQESKMGAYAHASFFPQQKFSLISNSPECLFQSTYDKDQNHLKVWSMPIKGTLKFDSAQTSFKQAWSELKNSSKNQAELFMITDLLRNDLGKINTTPVDIIAKKRPLLAPGLLHQYSLISTSLNLSNESICLLDMIKALFPGGSITGAPKKRVMRIIKSLEVMPRGFYCGSTILAHKTKIAASINIRSGEVDWDTGRLRVGAGGGVTLDSLVDEEYDEMLGKYHSIIEALMGDTRV